MCHSTLLVSHVFNPVRKVLLSILHNIIQTHTEREREIERKREERGDFWIEGGGRRNRLDRNSYIRARFMKEAHPSRIGDGDNAATAEPQAGGSCYEMGSTRYILFHSSTLV